MDKEYVQALLEKVRHSLAVTVWTTATIPKEGYGVYIRDYTVKLPTDLDNTSHVSSYFATHLTHGKGIALSIDDGTLHLNVITVLPDLQRARLEALYQDQDYVIDLATNSTVN